VSRRGKRGLLDRGRVLDVLGEGELFGHPSMLSGLPTGFEARAAEAALCYRLAPAAVGERLRPPRVRAGPPTGFGARAAEDALSYRLPAEAVVPLLARPAGLRFVAR